MNVSLSQIRKMQDGGAVPPEAAGAGAPAGGEDPMMQLVQGAAQALQGQDCNMAMQVCQMLVQLAQGAGGGAPAGAPAEGAPAEGEPVYRAGGRLIRRVRK